MLSVAVADCVLGYDGTGFKVDESDPIDTSMIIVDESSMLDIVLAYALFRAISPDAHLLLVGDVDQLPSVGAGDVLRDIIASKRFPTTRLDTIFRQKETSAIIRSAHHINHGEMPELDDKKELFFFDTKNDAVRTAEMIVDVISKRIPTSFPFNPWTDIQCLAPMKKGEAGTIALNQRLQAALNPAGSFSPAHQLELALDDEEEDDSEPPMTEIQIGSTLFRVGDKLLLTKNHHQENVYNGDLGTLMYIDRRARQLEVRFDERIVAFSWADALDDFLLGYATTVHKSQGSEFPVVVIPLIDQHYMMLRRNLLYTALTRAKQMAVIVGSRDAIAKAVRNNSLAERYSALTLRLLNQL